MLRTLILCAFAAPMILRADLPLAGVSLTVKPLSIRAARGTPRQTDYGRFEKFAGKSVALEIEARRTVRGDARVSVEWYFLARDVATRKPFVFDAARADLTLQEGVSEKFSVASGAGAESEPVYPAVGKRSKKREHLWGWFVMVRSGNSIIASEASLFEVREWCLKALRERAIDRPPLAKRKSDS